MRAQERVAAFVAAHELEAPPEYRLLDLVAEVGELAENAAETSGYGSDPEEVAVEADELGDALFSLLALAAAVDVDAEDALDGAIEKYAARVERSGSPSSGG